MTKNDQNDHKRSNFDKRWLKIVKMTKIDQNDKIAVYMNGFNEYIEKNKKVTKLILPVRDGLTLIIKNEN